MPRIRLHLPAFRLRRSPFAPAPPGGRLFGMALVGTGVLLLAVASAPVLVGAQSTDSRFGGFGEPHDPGVRGGPAGAGGALTGATALESAVFTNSRDVFNELDSVSGAPIDGANGSGLGPRFNLDSCSGCHAQPDVGGSSPFVNPQIAAAHRANASNPEDLSAFIKVNGPVREVRFKTNPDGSPDGGVHDLFTITGRPDAVGCNVAQPDFKAALAANNAIFRIPTPTFGAGLIEAIPDQVIIDNKNANARCKKRPRHLGSRKSRRQRRHDHPLWLESPEQVAPDLRRAKPTTSNRASRTRSSRTSVKASKGVCSTPRPKITAASR